MSAHPELQPRLSEQLLCQPCPQAWLLPAACSQASLIQVVCVQSVPTRAAAACRQASLILAEDTRRTGLLRAHLGISTPMLSFHRHNEHGRQEQVGKAFVLAYATFCSVSAHDLQGACPLLHHKLPGLESSACLM